jgi:hypothetical protein
VESVEGLGEELRSLPEVEVDPAAGQARRITGKRKAAYASIPRPPALGEANATPPRRAKQLAQAQPHTHRGVVIDYQATLDASSSPLRGDTTYYVSGPVSFNSLTLESGAVLKFKHYTTPTEGDAYVKVNGTLTCRTSANRPAIFTAANDDTEGEPLPAQYKTVTLQTDGYANPALWTYFLVSPTLSHVRFRYAKEALRVTGNPAGSATVTHAQWVNCVKGIVITGCGSGSCGVTVTVKNSLFAQVNRPFSGSVPYAAYANLNNCTVDNTAWSSSEGCYLVTTTPPGSTTTGYFINSIAANVPAGHRTIGNATASGSYNGFYGNGADVPFGSNQRSAGSFPFQTGPAGDYYLDPTAGSAFIDSGSQQASLAGLHHFTTDPDNTKEQSTVDLGYHFSGTVLPTTGLVGHWKLDGTGTDYSGSGNAATLYGPTWSAGRLGQALDFDGSDDYATVTDSAVLRLDRMTVAFWLRKDGEPALRTRLIGKGDSGGTQSDRNYGVWEEDGAGKHINFKFQTQSGAWADFNSTVELDVGRWYHVACSYDGSTAAVYIDGLLAGRQAIEGVPVTSTAPLRFGYVSGYAYLNGALDDVRLYNRALNPAEISLLATGGSQPADTDADGQADSDEDTSGNGLKETSESDWQAPSTCLWNVNFGGGTKTGPAAVGYATTDTWDNYGSLSGATIYPRLSDKTRSDVALSVVGFPSLASSSLNANQDMMYKSALMASVRIEMTLRNLPPGTYCLYLYGHGPSNSDNSRFLVETRTGVDGQDLTGTYEYLNGSLASAAHNSTDTGTDWLGTTFKVTKHYRLYTVTVREGERVKVTVFPGLGSGGAAYLNGLQIGRLTRGLYLSSKESLDLADQRTFDLLQYVKNNQFNYLAIYGAGDKTAGTLAAFIKEAKTKYGVFQVGTKIHSKTVEWTPQATVGYNDGHLDAPIDVLNLEMTHAYYSDCSLATPDETSEFWNIKRCSQHTDPLDWKSFAEGGCKNFDRRATAFDSIDEYLGLLQDMREKADQSGKANLLVETYLGYPTCKRTLLDGTEWVTEWKAVLKRADRVLVHAYEDTPHVAYDALNHEDPYEGGSARFRMDDSVATHAPLQGGGTIKKPTTIWPIFSAEGPYLGPYFRALAPGTAENVMKSRYGFGQRDGVTTWEDGVVNDGSTRYLTQDGFMYFKSNLLLPLLREGFERSQGYDDASGWSELNNPDEDYTGMPLTGAQSWRAVASASVRTASHAFVAGDKRWFYFQVRITGSTDTTAKLFSVLDSGGSELAYVERLASGALRVWRGGGASNATSAVLPADTKMHVWVYYQASTGIEGVASVAFSNNGVMPTAGTGFTQIASGTSMAQAASLKLWGNTAYEVVMDDVQANVGEIGSQPN